MKLKSTLALSALMIGAGIGAADARDGAYIRGDAGVTIDGNVDFPVLSDSDFDENEMFSAGAGYAFSNGFRVEGEFSNRDNEFTDGAAIFPAAGDANVTALMANLYYDFNHNGSIQPYIGIGGGVARHDIDGGAFIIGYDSDSTDYAYQGLVGVNWEFANHWSADLGYRYFVIPNATYEFNLDPGVNYEDEYKHQAVTIGLRYSFGSPAPAPVVAPPPAPLPPPPPPQPVAQACPTSEFVVYFEWDRSNLNQAAMETIDAAVNRARQCNVGGVVVIGHTDTSGSPTYNQGLSERRASVVRDALVSRGMAAGSIQTQARGEGDLARPTRDGVREPLNRRTAVTISFR